MKILMVLAPKEFREIEYLVPRAFWEQAGATVFTLSTVKTSLGRFGYKVENDYLFSDPDISAEHFDGCFFVGGNGSLVYQEDAAAKSLAESFVERSKPLGAICAAPRNFLSWGLLAGKRCTGWNGDNALPTFCEKAGAIFTGKVVEVDGRILTANGPEASEAAALEFLSLLR